jgi:histidinol-phosphate aminotransferase
VPSAAPRLEDARLFPYTPDPSTAARAEQLGVPRIARLDANETHLGPFPAAVEAARRAMGDAHRYPQHGSALVERLAERHQVGEDSIVVAHGADPLIGYLAAAFLDPGDEAVMAVPSFVSYAQDVLRVGGRAVEVPVRSDGALDLPAMGERLSKRTRLVFVCNPNNPTGGTLPRRDLDGLLEAIPPTVLVVLDEAYAEYVEAADYAGGPELAAARPNVAVLRTFSKLFGLAGLRIGYMIGPPAVVLAVRRLRHWFDVSDAAHLAALASLADPAEIARRADSTRAARQRLTAILAGHGLATLPSEASFVAARVTDAVALADRLAARGVLVRPVPDRSGDLLRIVAGDDADLALLDAALSDVATSRS